MHMDMKQHSLMTELVKFSARDELNKTCILDSVFLRASSSASGASSSLPCLQRHLWLEMLGGSMSSCLDAQVSFSSWNVCANPVSLRGFPNSNVVQKGGAVTFALQSSAAAEEHEVSLCSTQRAAELSCAGAAPINKPHLTSGKFMQALAGLVCQSAGL